MGSGKIETKKGWPRGRLFLETSSLFLLPLHLLEALGLESLPGTILLPLTYSYSWGSLTPAVLLLILSVSFLRDLEGYL